MNKSSHNKEKDLSPFSEFKSLTNLTYLKINFRLYLSMNIRGTKLKDIELLSELSSLTSLIEMDITLEFDFFFISKRKLVKRPHHSKF